MTQTTSEVNETRLRILEVLARMGPRSRDTIARFTKIPRSTVFENLDAMRRLGYVRYYYKKGEKHAPGRPKTMWVICI